MIGFRCTPYGRREVVLYGGSCVAAAIACLFVEPWISVVPSLGAVAIAAFFRDPHRVVPREPGCVVSPADGRVADVEEVDEAEYLGGRAVRIGIFLSVFNVHVNRAPAAGTVESVRYRPGRFRSAFTEESTRHNESNSVGIRTGEGWRLLVRQVSGAVARRIVCAVREGDAIERGQRIGMIKFGSRTEIFLPVDRVTELRVRVGDVVRGGSSVLALARE